MGLVRSAKAFVLGRDPAAGEWQDHEVPPDPAVLVAFHVLAVAGERDRLDHDAGLFHHLAHDRAMQRFAGYREHVERDEDGRVRRHFVILPFACRWIAGEGVPLLDELSELRWLRPSALAELTTTPGLAAIVAAAFEQMEAG